ncbi:hypothetical protein OG241_06380 [Streptomyces sp. NBC_01390]|uniref:hypothetical protein n=1 Tax=Streptomyces sp. NBC_01390 TaxID=2903850 RepID=UPI00324D17FF
MSATDLKPVPAQGKELTPDRVAAAIRGCTEDGTYPVHFAESGLPGTPPDETDWTPPLGRRQANLLTAALRGLPLLGRTHDPDVVTTDDAMTALRSLPHSTDAVEAGRANRMRPRLLTAVIGPAARRTGYVYGLPHHGVEPLLQAVTRAAQAPLVLRIVYGASTTIPLRALSYILPAIQMAARLTAVGCRTPYIQVVLASSLGCQINSLAQDDVAEETAVLARSLDQVLSVLAPGRYGICRTPSDTSDVLGALHQLIAGLTSTQQARVIERLAGKGGATTDEQTLLYAASHVLVHDRESIALALDRGTPVPQNAVVIDIGGLQERHFYDARRLFSPLTQSASPGALVLSRHSVPPYTMARGGDIALRDFLSTGQTPCLYNEVAPAVRHDLRLLSNLLPLEILLPPATARPGELL